MIEPEKLIKEFQKILNITDWDIEIEYFDDLNYLNIQGLINFIDYGSKTAILKLNTNHKDEFSDTIIHELIHIIIHESNIENIPYLTENYLPPMFFETLKLENDKSTEKIVCAFTKILSNLYKKSL